MRFTYGDVCSGISAPSAAWHPLGWEAAFYAELQPFPSRVLAKHYPNVPNYGDITKFREWPDHSIDLLVGGTPCQSFSVAGLRAGLRDPRGNLALVFLGILDRYRPRWVLWENVPGVHTSWSDEAVRPPTEAERELLRKRGLDPDGYEHAEQTSDFDGILAGMAELGYGIATTVLDAQFFGVAQQRRRVFALGHLGGDWQRAAAVLFDTSCLRGTPPPRRPARQETLAEPTGRLGGGRQISQAITEASGKARPGDNLRSIETLVIPAISANGAHKLGFNGADGLVVPDLSPALETQAGGLRAPDTQAYVGTRNGVRRLTPLECERLQGFPDNYTKVDEATKDLPRYKVLSNSIAVPVLRWIGERIEMVEGIKRL
jgi:DNA (cytosine-5)-methyltransferase 1